MRRHVRELHNEDDPSANVGGQKQHVCQDCGKVFKFASKLQKHENSHVKLDSVEAFCSEPGCMKYFSNEKCLKAHIQSCHQHITCEICGTKKLKRNIERHLCTHEGGRASVERIKCSYKGCLHTFSTKSNLHQHVKAVHLEHKPFVCSFSGCGMRFAYKHVRDKHEKTGRHVYAYVSIFLTHNSIPSYVGFWDKHLSRQCHIMSSYVGHYCFELQGDFEEADEQFRSRPRGGRKRKYPTIEMLVRKRVTPPDQLGQESEYRSWLL
ncbi:PREDICTED: mRNAion factor [Prunus dulcis]|uniref:PREDICTED: mRNAion factor n=1 Tax=Prunus dulcis TaxID=3755 RepID=A0A5E4E456_PRUDU|nr:PREDICTED: mRNAion factor [Prunus dulcis]